MQVKIFGKKDCAKCRTTKNKIEFFVSKWNLKEKLKILFLDLDTVEGLTEGALNDVLRVPTTILERDGDVLVRWDGEVPNSDEFKNYII